jgi:hypothetical protein
MAAPITAARVNKALANLESFAHGAKAARAAVKNAVRAAEVAIKKA